MKKWTLLLTCLSVVLSLSSCQPGGTAQAPTSPEPSAAAPIVLEKLPLPTISRESWSVAQVKAGSGELDFQDGPAAQATFNYPYGVLVQAGGKLLIADRFNHRIRLLLNDTVSTLAGTRQPGLQDGPALTARFDNPQALAWGPGGSVYIADTGNHALRLLSAAGEVSTLTQDLVSPTGLVTSPTGVVYIADAGKHQILRYHNQQLEVFAGSGQPGLQDGQGQLAQFFSPRDLALDAQGNLWVADALNHAIRLIDPNGQVRTLAGNGEAGGRDGTGADVRFNEPVSIDLDQAGNALVIDLNNRRLRRVLPTGEVKSLDIPAEIRKPQALSLSPEGIYLADSSRQQIWFLALTE